MPQNDFNYSRLLKVQYARNEKIDFLYVDKHQQT